MKCNVRSKEENECPETESLREFLSLLLFNKEEGEGGGICRIFVQFRSPRRQ